MTSPKRRSSAPPDQGGQEGKIPGLFDNIFKQDHIDHARLIPDRSMKIVMRNGRVFQATALQIVKAMQDIAFDVESFTVPKYIAWVVANARKFEQHVESETDEELAASLVAEMLRTGLTANGKA